MTPNLSAALNSQKSKTAEDIFGKIQPINLEGTKQKNILVI
jgi:hypothetical protein